MGLCGCGICRRDQGRFYDRSLSPFGVRRLQGGGRCHGAGVRPLFPDADLLPARGVSHRTKPFRSRTPWISQLLDQVQPQKPDLPDFRLQGKTGSNNIHSLDVARFMNEFILRPRIGEVYNLGGGRGNSISILEALDLIGQISGKKMSYEYIDRNRKGDHICYVSDLSKTKGHYPGWILTKNLHMIFEEIYDAWTHRF